MHRTRRLDELNAKRRRPQPLERSAERAEADARAHRRWTIARRRRARSSNELDDNVGLIELGEAENDAAMVADAENAHARP